MAGEGEKSESECRNCAPPHSRKHLQMTARWRDIYGTAREFEIALVRTWRAAGRANGRADKYQTELRWRLIDWFLCCVLTEFDA